MAYSLSDIQTAIEITNAAYAVFDEAYISELRVEDFFTTIKRLLAEHGAAMIKGSSRPLIEGQYESQYLLATAFFDVLSSGKFNLVAEDAE